MSIPKARVNQIAHCEYCLGYGIVLYYLPSVEVKLKRNLSTALHVNEAYGNFLQMSLLAPIIAQCKLYK